MKLFGQVVINPDSAESTNLLALKLIETGEAVNGMAIITGHQTAGKGYGTNRWESEPGKNLTVSFIYQPAGIRAADQFYLNKAVSLAVSDLLYFTGLPGSPDIFIKWPNDAYIGDRKVGGILISHIISGEMIECSVIGIGLNINQIQFSEDIPNPVSFKAITGFDYNIDEVFRHLCQRLDHRMEQFQNHEFDKIQSGYLHNLYKLNIPGWFSAGNHPFEAIIRGVDPFGRLITEVDGEIREFAFKEIEYLL